MFSEKKLKRNAIATIQVGFLDYKLAKKDYRRIYSSLRNLYAGTLLLIKFVLLHQAPEDKKASILLKNRNGKNKWETISRADLKERFEEIGIQIDTELEQLDKIATVRHEIEHKYTQHPFEILENHILKFYFLIDQINQKFCKFEINELYPGDSYAYWAKIKETTERQKKMCIVEWKKVKPDLTKSFSELRKSKDEPEFEDDLDYVLDFLLSIVCPCCTSELVLPLDHDFSKFMNIDLACKFCNEEFYFREVVQSQLELYYEYEIMKVGAKGGRFPLKICCKCKLGSFLVYKGFCIYCGNTQEPSDYDKDFLGEIYSRNASRGLLEMLI